MTIEKNNPHSIQLVCECLNDGCVVILPTDTVYGFSSKVDFPESTAKKIIKIKGRNENKPFIQLIANPNDIYDFTDEKIPSQILEFWPGPLTIIIPLKIELQTKFNATTIAFRCPGDKWLREIIQNCKSPIYSTSVNRSGKSILDEEKKIITEFENEVELIVTDGDKKNSQPSTIISVESGNIKTIRQGILNIDYKD